MPDVNRHGPVPKKMPEMFVHVERVNFENCSFTFTGDFNFKNNYDWTAADR